MVAPPVRCNTGNSNTVVYFCQSLISHASNGREMSCTPDLGKMTTAHFTVCCYWVYKNVFRFPRQIFNVSSFSPTKGASEAQSRRRRDVSSIELMAECMWLLDEAATRQARNKAINKNIVTSSLFAIKRKL